MKVEIDERTQIAIIVVAVCFALVGVSFFVYKYNVAVYELGYTQEQVQGNITQIPIWVKKKHE